MANSILQANINHSRDGHDMLMQNMMEGDFSIDDKEGSGRKGETGGRYCERIVK